MHVPVAPYQGRPKRARWIHARARERPCRENVEAYREANREAVNVFRAPAVDGHSKNRRDEEERQDRLEEEGSAEAEQLGILFPSKSRAKPGHRDSRLGKELLEEEGRDGGSRQLRNDVGDARAELYPPRGRH